MLKEIRLEVELPSPTLMKRLGRLRGVTLNVLRARVTESRAWALLDVSGAAAKVEALLRHFRERGFSIRALSPGSSLA